MTADAALLRRSRARSWHRDGIEAVPYIVASIAIALMIADGGLLTVKPIDYVYAGGRALGIIAAVLMLSQVALAARIPLIEKALGHDRAIAVHTRLGKAAIVLMAFHAGVISLMSAYYADISWWDQTVAMFTSQWYLAMAQVALGLFAVVFATALLVVRRRWRYETWHAVHLITYVAVAAAIPHQFLEGSTFRDGGPVTGFWWLLYLGAFGSLIAFRVIRPLRRWRRHGLRVAAVESHGGAYTSVRIAGDDIERLRVQPGQFFLWRFVDRQRWRSAHPFTVSDVSADGLRLTAKVVGDGSGGLATLAVGTRVLVEGPFGVFTGSSRNCHGAVLVAAGIGVTPIRALLANWTDADGPVAVIVRVRSREEAPLLDELETIAAAKGVPLTVIEGPRGDGWSAVGQPLRLLEIVPDAADRDIYVCGPAAWAQRVIDDAVSSGVAKENVHREAFGWHRESV